MPHQLQCRKDKKRRNRVVNRCSVLFFWIRSTAIFLSPPSARIHMDAPVASKIIVSFHQHSDGPYFRPHARSKQKVPPSVSELYPKPKREIIQTVHFISTFSSTDTELTFRMHKHFDSGKFKQSKAYKSSASLYFVLYFSKVCV